MSTNNVILAIRDMENYLQELSFFEDRKKEIYKQVVICNDLMNYSYLVANIESDDWKLLEKLVHKVFVKLQE